ncbi:DNA-binding protein WhiA [Aerococcus sanguinicola]|uniref:Probable cell division protein WhiA n=1 Tax=Aerococcus sanguinicola TaxID=119206 RepID=A0A0X8FBX4_9LACT|nr:MULTISPECIES: DNA-binding protein WhiA [Aerococcus]AMB94309.1 sporulation regulator WhiA [Aerococcus sanguinicola]MDK7049908.1 DNA-binding protein WhiA [Aerococcus sanguinicola]OFT92600.1 sporulation regulator WhiA [Aerococcus sp. HMSC23C02]PKZ22487.1 DNA-binding protein WhiA [Aerococcus sanguinicola]
MSSFAADVKKELTRIEVSVAEAQAELSALVRMNGSINLLSQGLVLNVQTENAAIARRIYSLFKKTYQVTGEIIVRRKMKLKKNNVYIVRIHEEAQAILSDMEILDRLMIIPQVPQAIKADPKLAKAYLRGAFLAAGSVNNPETSSYHLEIYSIHQSHNQDIIELMNAYDLNARQIERRSGYITYLKEAEKISDFLALLGATQAILRFEDVRVMRDMRNSINRIVNCESANLNKTVTAAGKQIENINYIEARVGLGELPVKLREIAEARLKHPGASLKELGETLESGPVSKSGVNHRLRKINQFAEELRRQ